jgi:NCS2 family nucleobase:cation symporter-2
MLVILGLFPKLGALIALIPLPVLGSAGVIMFSMIILGGMKCLRDVEFTTRNMLVISIGLAAGLIVSVRPTIVSDFPEPLNIFFSSGITTGTFFMVVLNLILPKKG